MSQTQETNSTWAKREKPLYTSTPFYILSGPYSKALLKSGRQTKDMARIKHSKESEESVVTSKPTPPASRQMVNAKEQASITLNVTPIPAPKETGQPKRRTLQDRRPTLKGLQRPVERKIVTKPTYSKEGNTVTKGASETKEIVAKPVSASKLGVPTVKPLYQKDKSPLNGVVGVSRVVQARQQQERAIEAAQAMQATQQREGTDMTQAPEQRRLSLDSQSRYQRKG